MEKLSGILPSNARLKSVDVKDSKPVRPGAPDFGRPKGSNSVQDRMNISAQALQLAADDHLAFKDPKEASRSQIVKNVTDNFFNNRLREALPATESVVSDESDDVVPESVTSEAAVGLLSQVKPKAMTADESGPARGERLDVVG
ncbi:MAG: hypothetical protein LW875_05595 [Proteobacteria bacterium]|jgi:hypothetical protein|nr:hypothetical protein [Pseudomonadota bacterium]